MIQCVETIYSQNLKHLFFVTKSFGSTFVANSIKNTCFFIYIFKNILFYTEWPVNKICFLCHERIYLFRIFHISAKFVEYCCFEFSIYILNTLDMNKTFKFIRIKLHIRQTENKQSKHNSIRKKSIKLKSFQIFFIYITEKLQEFMSIHLLLVWIL